MLEVVAIDIARLGVLVGHDVVRVLLDLKGDALLGKTRGSEVVQNLGVRAGACANKQGGRCAIAYRRTLGSVVTATSSKTARNSQASNAGNTSKERTTREVD